MQVTQLPYIAPRKVSAPIHSICVKWIDLNEEGFRTLQFRYFKRDDFALTFLNKLIAAGHQATVQHIAR